MRLKLLLPARLYNSCSHIARTNAVADPRSSRMIIHIPGLVLVGLYALRLISLTSIPCVLVTYGFTLHFLTVDFKGVFLGFVAFGWLVLVFAGFVLPCLLWLAALACCSYLSSMLAIHGGFRCHSMALRVTFRMARKVTKSAFRRYSALRVACGNFQNHVINRPALIARTSCAAALCAPSMALQPVADMILKTE